MIRYYNGKINCKKCIDSYSSVLGSGEKKGSCLYSDASIHFIKESVTIMPFFRSLKFVSKIAYHKNKKPKHLRALTLHFIPLVSFSLHS